MAVCAADATLIFESELGCLPLRRQLSAVSFPSSAGHCYHSPLAPPGGGMGFNQRLAEVRTGFERSFWVANVSELFERLSYYAAFASLARYLHETLSFPTERAADLSSLFGGLVWFLAIFGGAIADRLGFRRALAIAYLILAGSYFLLGSLGAPWLAPVRDAVPLVGLVTVVLMLPALGVALMNPCVAGTTARASNDNLRSSGYSMYYTLVDIVASDRAALGVVSVRRPP